MKRRNVNIQTTVDDTATERAEEVRSIIAGEGGTTAVKVGRRHAQQVFGVCKNLGINGSFSNCITT